MKKSLILALLTVFVLTGCGAFSPAMSTPTLVPISSILIDSGAGKYSTPTPFQPIPLTPTPTMTIVPTRTIAPIPTGTAQLPTPSLGNIPRATGQINVLILGSDYRPNQGFRTDVIMLLSLNPDKGTATLTSFPRDLYVSIPGVGMERINTAQEYGGFALTTATFQQDFGFTPDYYIMTNFAGFTSIVDTLGGVDVAVATPLTDQCSFTNLQNGMGYCTIPAGSYHMDGKLALWYVRSRYSTSDFDRTRRAQEVITAIFHKLISLNGINRAAELYGLFGSSVETNMPLTEIVSLLPLASQLAGNSAAIRRYAIGPGETYNYIVPGSGAMVLIPDQNAVIAILQQALN